MVKRSVQSQFGANADAYATSEVHAKGYSLARLVEVVDPQPGWIVLDVATAAGHTAHAFAPHVRQVVASDITDEMLEVSVRLGQDLGLNNVVRLAADAENLPMTGKEFDLVTCRLAAHHFPNVEKFMEEAWRVLRNDGILAVVDNIVPGSHLRGKKGRIQADSGRYVNAFDKLRDPSHVHSLSIEEWQRCFYESGFRLVHQEIERKAMNFNSWAKRMRVSAENIIRLRAMLHQAPKPVIEFLNPQFTANETTFDLSEAILVGKKDSPHMLDLAGGGG